MTNPCFGRKQDADMHSIAVGNQILLCGIDGRLWCIDATADHFTQQWAAQLPEASTVLSQPWMGSDFC